MRRARPVMGALMGAATTLFTVTAHAQSSDEQAIRAARERSNRAIAAHDVAALSAEWMEELVVTASTGAQRVGRQANVTSFANQFAERPDVVYRRIPSRVAVYRPWSMAGESGEWQGSWTARGVRIRVGGTYTAKWRRVDGRWRILAEVYVPEYCEGGPYCTTPPTDR